MSEALHPPEPLRAFLDAGGDLTGVDGWEGVAEMVLCFECDDDYRRRCIDAFRRWTGRWIEYSKVGPVGVDQAMVTEYAWKADALEDGELARRVEAAIPAQFRVGLGKRRPGRAGRRLRPLPAARRS